MANAHAGIADRYLKMKISVDALMLVFAVTQVSTYIFLKYSKSKVSCWYKKLIIRIVKRINKKSYIKWCASWALSSLVFTPYVMGLCTEFFLLAFIPLVVFLIYYSCMVLNMEKLEKHLTGIRGLSLLLSVSFQQALCYLIYALICETSTFHRFVYYTDEEYEMFDLKLYPGIEAFNYIKEWFAFISIITAIPFIVLLLRYLFYTFIKAKLALGRRLMGEARKDLFYTFIKAKPIVWPIITFAFNLFLLLAWAIMTIGGFAVLILKLIMLNNAIASSLPQYMIDFVDSIQGAFLIDGIVAWIQLILFNLLMPLYVIGQFLDVKFRARKLFRKHVLF